MKIALFTDAGPTGAMAEAIVRANAPDAAVLAVRSRQNRVPQGLPDIAQFDLLLSCLNPLILPETFLGKARLGDYNFHPGLPEYPGRDPYHWAFLPGETRAGATLHLMDARVDHGDILEVMHCGFDRAEGVERYIWACTGLALQLLGKVTRAVAGTQARPQKCGDWCWREGRRPSREDLLALRCLPPDASEEDVQKRIDALHVQGQAEVFVELAGKRFYYRP